MPEELAFDQALRHRRQVHRHEGTAAPVGVVVDVPGEHLLACPALARDQDRDRLGGDLLGDPRHVAHRGGVPQHHWLVIPTRLLFTQPRQLAGRLELVERLRHARVQLGRREVLGDVVERPQVHRLDGDRDLLDHRDHDDADVGVLLAHLPEDLEAADAGHLHVEEHHVDRTGFHRPQRLLAGGDRDGAHAGGADDRLHRLPHAGIVVHDQDGRRPRHLLANSTATRTEPTPDSRRSWRERLPGSRAAARERR